MGSNSFRLEVGRVEGDQIFRLDTCARTLRLGAGSTRSGRPAADARRAALACLARFGERLTGLHPSAVRAVATNTLRVASNAATFLPQAERALGFPIDIITGYEEARLIYLGVAHVLPRRDEPRLVIDIGGGSTEFIIGRGLDAARTRVAEDRLRRHDAALLRATARCRRPRSPRRTPSPAPRSRRSRATSTAATGPRRTRRPEPRWRWPKSSSRTGCRAGGHHARTDSLRLRKRMVAAGHVSRLALAALKPERAPVLAGGLAVMAAAMDELDVDRINPVGGALRLGVLYDLLGRTVAARHPHRDRRSVPDALARRSRARGTGRGDGAVALFGALVAGSDPGPAQRLDWAALLHETGFSVSHTGFHKHGAYILQNADMPGFSAREQSELAALVLGCRGRLAEDGDRARQPGLSRPAPRAAPGRAVPSRAAADRSAAHPRPCRGRLPGGDPGGWLKSHPLTAHLLEKERAEWTSAGIRLALTQRPPRRRAAQLNPARRCARAGTSLLEQPVRLRRGPQLPAG